MAMQSEMTVPQNPVLTVFQDFPIQNQPRGGGRGGRQPMFNWQNQNLNPNLNLNQNQNQ